MMVTSDWKKLGSPNLSPSTITLHPWDGHPSQPFSLYHNCPIIVVGKIFLIDIKFIDAPLDYNILLVPSYTYSMFFVASSIFCKMCFPHNGKIITIDYLTYYDPQSQTSPHTTISFDY